jgi:hypothetical protein
MQPSALAPEASINESNLALAVCYTLVALH